MSDTNVSQREYLMKVHRNIVKEIKEEIADTSEQLDDARMRLHMERMRCAINGQWMDADVEEVSQIEINALRQQLEALNQELAKAAAFDPRDRFQLL